VRRLPVCSRLGRSLPNIENHSCSGPERTDRNESFGGPLW
jgi:hypothetical protein